MKRWFSPQLLGLHLLAVVVVAACILMGFWQLGVYGAKHADTAARARHQAAVPLVQVWGPDDPYVAELVGRPVSIRGVFSGQQFRIRRNSGVWIVAPLNVDGTQSALLVVRGSAAGGEETPKLPSGPVRFKATVEPGESAPGDYDSSTQTMAALSIPAFTNVVHRDLFSGYAVTSDSVVTGGLAPVASAATSHGPHVSWTVGLRNLAYALQWWIFGLFTVFMWWRMCTDAVALDRAVDESVADTSVT